LLNPPPPKKKTKKQKTKKERTSGIKNSAETTKSWFSLLTRKFDYTNLRHPDILTRD
jgi:hypothetical protein